MQRDIVIYLVILSSILCASTARSETLWASKIWGFSFEKSPTQYSASQILGPPSVMPDFGETPCAWSPAILSNRTQWITVGFSKAIPVRQVAVAENINPGAIAFISVIDSSGRETKIWQDLSPHPIRKLGRMLNIFTDSAIVSSAVKISLYTEKYYESYQIDAVAISSDKDTVKYEINLAKDIKLASPPENLGPNVNSEYNELAPVITADGKTLYFTREKHPDNIGPMKAQDVWVSHKDDNGIFGKAVNIGPPVNNSGNNFATAVTADGNGLLLGNIYNPDSSLSQGVSISYTNGMDWSWPKMLEIDSLDIIGNRSSYSIASNGKILLISAQRNDSHGGNDVYASFLGKDGVWSKPLNLGPKLNTAADEETPFLAADNVTLFFSSDGYCGYGSNDIFVSRRLDDSWTNWSAPENLGPVINTPGWDAYFTMPASGDDSYFISSNSGYGNEDIFRIKLPESLKPRPVILIRGKVLNSKTGLPLSSNIKYEILPTGTEAGIARSNPVTGEYRLTLPGGFKYGFLAEAPGFISINENLDLTNLGSYGEIVRDLSLVPAEKGETARINNIFFNFAEYDLLPDSFSELNRLADFLEKNPKVFIEIDGHTDNVGSEQNNLVLSLKRAQSVANFLFGKGIDSKRIKVKGFGKQRPVASNSTDEGRRMNRRVEFTIISK